MKWGKSELVRGALAGAAALSLSALSLAGCTDANDALIIVQAQVPDETCKVSEEGSGGARRTEGVLDLGLDRPYGYMLFPLIANNLPSLSSTGGIDPNRVQITGAEMKILPPAGVTVAWPEGCGTEFDDGSTAVVNPGERRAITIQVVKSCHAAAFRDLFLKGALNPALTDIIKLRVVVRAVGRHGSTSIKSDPFEYPIRICYGCLQTGFTGDYAAFSYERTPPKVPACENLVENPYRGNVCNPAQDFGPVLCCAQDPKGEKLICPAVPTAKPPPTTP
jgi:hypothetical protein